MFSDKDTILKTPSNSELGAELLEATEDEGVLSIKDKSVPLMMKYNFFLLKITKSDI